MTSKHKIIISTIFLLIIFVIVGFCFFNHEEEITPISELDKTISETIPPVDPKPPISKTNAVINKLLDNLGETAQKVVESRKLSNSLGNVVDRMSRTFIPRKKTLKIN